MILGVGRLQTPVPMAFACTDFAEVFDSRVLYTCLLISLWAAISCLAHKVLQVDHGRPVSP